MIAAKKKEKIKKKIPWEGEDKAGDELMDGGVRMFLSYRSCNTTEGDHLEWHSSFLNGLTNAHMKGHYRKVLCSKLEKGRKKKPFLNHTGPSAILFPLHCTARAGKKNYCCQGY